MADINNDEGVKAEAYKSLKNNLLEQSKQDFYTKQIPQQNDFFLAEFPFTISITELEYYYQKLNEELLNDLRQRIFESQEFKENLKIGCRRSLLNSFPSRNKDLAIAFEN